jgi:hypothetical protein
MGNLHLSLLLVDTTAIFCSSRISADELPIRKVTGFFEDNGCALCLVIVGQRHCGWRQFHGLCFARPQTDSLEAVQFFVGPRHFASEYFT